MASRPIYSPESYLQGIRQFSQIDFSAGNAEYCEHEPASPEATTVAGFSSTSSPCSLSITSPTNLSLSWTSEETPSRQLSNSSYSSHSTDPAEIWTPASNFSPSCMLYSEPESYSAGILSPVWMQADTYAYSSQFNFSDVMLDADLAIAEEPFCDVEIIDQQNGPVIPGYGSHFALEGCDKFVCSCGKEYSGEWALGNWQRHIKIVRNRSENKRLVCTHCGHTFTRSDNLHKHCIEFHPSKDCSHCVSSCRRSRKQEPPASSLPGQRYQCPTCGKKFSKQDAYNEHIATQHTAQE